MKFKKLSVSASIAIIFLLLGVFRLGSLVLHDPMLGYANNYDMIRIQSEFGFFPKVNGVLFKGGQLEAPFRLFSRTEDRSLFYVTSQSWIVNVADVLDQWMGSCGAQQFDMKTNGLVSIFLLIGAGVVLTVLFYRMHPLAGLVSSLLFFLILADPVNSLWANTFYSEFSAILGLYWTLGVLILLLRKGVESNPFLLVWAGLSLVFFGLAKFQYIFLPPLLVLALAIRAFRTINNSKRFVLAIGFLLICSGIPALAQKQIENDPYMRVLKLANATNAFFGAFLPEFENQDRALRWLRLRENCRSLIGKTWYTKGVRERHMCREIAYRNRAALIPLLVLDPGVLPRVSWKALQVSRPWIFSNLGQMESGASRQLETISGGWLFSLAYGIQALSDGMYATLVLGIVLLSIIIVVVDWKRARENTGLISTVVYFATLIAGYVFFSALFGDGYFEFNKHTQLLATLIPTLGVCVLIHPFTRWKAGEGASPPK